MQLDTLRMENLDPLQKINKLIELYVTRVHNNSEIYKILHFEFSSKKRSINLDAELKKAI
jgi:hypothetical protein